MCGGNMKCIWNPDRKVWSKTITWETMLVNGGYYNESLINMEWSSMVDPSGSEMDPMASFCEQNDIHSDSTNWWNFLTNRIINCPNTPYHSGEFSGELWDSEARICSDLTFRRHKTNYSMKTMRFLYSWTVLEFIQPLASFFIADRYQALWNASGQKLYILINVAHSATEVNWWRAGGRKWTRPDGGLTAASVAGVQAVQGQLRETER